MEYQTTEQIQEQRVNLLSYNLFLRPLWIKTNESDWKDERLRVFCEQHLHHYDVVCLQELFGYCNNRKGFLLRKALKAGLLYFADCPCPSFFSNQIVDGGLLTVSRYPILASHFYEYSINVLADYISRKGVLYTQIQIGSEILHLFNTHTQASYIGKEEDVRNSVVTRLTQLQALTKMVTKALDKYGYREGELVMLLGDLNVNSTNPMWSRLFLEGRPDLSHPDLTKGEYFDEYKTMLHLLKGQGSFSVTDLLAKAHAGTRPPTYGHSENRQGQEVPLETVLTAPEEQCTNQSLDYAMQLQPEQVMGKARVESAERLEVDSGSFQVEPFLCEGQVFTQLSDHYGVTGQLVLSPRATN